MDFRELFQNQVDFYYKQVLHTIKKNIKRSQIM